MIEELINGIQVPQDLVNEDYIIYSPSKNTCYDTRLKYPSSNPIPSDGVKVSTENWQKYWCVNPPEGKFCEWDSTDKCFCWGDLTPPTLEECKETKLKEITDQYNSLVYAGFQSDGVSYESTLENQNRIMMAKMSGGGRVIGGGVMVNLTATQADQVFSDMSTHINGFNERYAKAQAEISEATTNDQVNQVVLL